MNRHASKTMAVHAYSVSAGNSFHRRRSAAPIVPVEAVAIPVAHGCRCQVTPPVRCFWLSCRCEDPPQYQHNTTRQRVVRTQHSTTQYNAVYSTTKHNTTPYTTHHATPHHTTPHNTTQHRAFVDQAGHLRVSDRSPQHAVSRKAPPAKDGIISSSS